MREKPPAFDQREQNRVPKPATARTWLLWLEAFAGCKSQREFARKTFLDSGTLRRFAEGMGGKGTAARLAGKLGIPLWVVHETMFPAIAAVNEVWRVGREEGERAFLEARNQSLEAAWRASLVVLLVSRDQKEHSATGADLHPADARVLLRWLESLGDGSREELARRAGLSRQILWVYARGDVAMSRLVLRRVVQGVGVPFWLVEGVMLPAVRAVRLVVEHERRGELLSGWEETLRLASQAGSVEEIRYSIQGMLESSRCVLIAEPSIEDRKLADNLWGQLANRASAERVRVVKNCRKFHSWALVERLCLESESAAAHSAKAALGLALLALRVARLAREEELFSLQLAGFAFLYIGNALRVAGKQRRAEEAFLRGLALWQAGSQSNQALLPAWRVPDLESSLLRDQRKFDEALDRLARAQDVAPREAWGRILVKKATVLDQKMEPEASIAVLWEAAPLIDEEWEPRLAFLWTCMMGVNFCHLERYREASDLLPKAQALASSLGRALDGLRLEWLRARIEAGLGHREEALSTFLKVQGQLLERKIAYDYALVSLELGEILLAEGRYPEVQELALKMEWIFKEEEIHPQAAKALDLFRRAVEGEAATPELARQVVRFLYGARYNPDLQLAA